MSLYEKLDERTLKVVRKYDDIAQAYALKTANSGSPDDMGRLVGLLSNPSAKILDVGCSAGRDCRWFSDKGFDIVGVDLSEGLLEIARKENPDLNFFQYDVRDMEFADNSFDAIWAHGILHELDRSEMKNALLEMNRVLKPGGFLFIRAKKGEGSSDASDAMSAGANRLTVYVLETELQEMMKSLKMKELSIEVTKSKSRELYWISAFYQK